MTTAGGERRGEDDHRKNSRKKRGGWADEKWTATRSILPHENHAPREDEHSLRTRECPREPVVRVSVMMKRRRAAGNRSVEEEISGAPTDDSDDAAPTGKAFAHWRR